MSHVSVKEKTNDRKYFLRKQMIGNISYAKRYTKSVIMNTLRMFLYKKTSGINILELRLIM
jgi:hypothetical protein